MYNYYIKIKEKEKLKLLISYPSYLPDRKVVKLNGSNYFYRAVVQLLAPAYNYYKSQRSKGRLKTEIQP